jgi:uncharacterized protein
MATAAAPTFLSAVELVDGGVWANYPIGVAAIEAIGMLGWLKILSIGTINEPGKPPRLQGKLPMAASVARLFMAGQAHSALGTAKIITGHVHRRGDLAHRSNGARRAYTLDNAGRISEMRERAFAEAREQLPELRRHFFGAPADEFVPLHAPLKRIGQENTVRRRSPLMTEFTRSGAPPPSRF